MFRRILRPSVAAARHFSTKKAIVPAPVPETLSSGGTKATGQRNTTAGTGKDHLGRWVFGLVYSNRSAVIAIRKWKEEGRVVQKYEVNRIVRELRQLKLYKRALEVCEWMKTQEDMKLVSGDYAVHLDLIAKIRGLNSAEKFFEDLPENMRDHATCNALLHTYVQNKETEKAEALMEKISECDLIKSPLPFNYILSLYISTEQLEKVPEIIKQLKKISSPDIVTYNLWLSACASLNAIETAEKVLLELTKAEIEPQWMTYSTMASMYIKNSLREKAVSALKEMEKRVSRKDRVAYSSLISLHTNLENKKEVRCIWRKMKATYGKLNDTEYTCMITSLLKLKELKEAEKLYDEWESCFTTKGSKVSNLLLAAYITNNQMETAEIFYNRMVEKGIVPGYTTWELLTWGYLKQKQVDKVLDCFEKAIRSVRKWDPDEKLVREVFTVVEEFGDVKGAEKLLKALRRAGYVNTEVYNFVLQTYAKAGKTLLGVEERMKEDNVEMDEETKRLVRATSKICVGVDT